MASLCATVSSVGFLSSSLLNADARQPSVSSSSYVPSSAVAYPSVRCGRGDSRTAKGKRFKGSFGNARPKDKSKGTGLAITPLPPRPPKKDVFDDGQYIEIDLDETLFAN